MTGPATQQVKEFRKPTAKEREHILEKHIGIQISVKDGTATVVVLGECDVPECPTPVPCCKYCKRPPC